jgi:hypothetical protein
MEWQPFPGAACYNVYQSVLGSSSFLAVSECIGRQTISVSKGNEYVVTAVTPSGETPFCAAVSPGITPIVPVPPEPVDPTRVCVNYYLTNTTPLHSDFTWDVLADVTGYNVYIAPIDDPMNFVLVHANVPAPAVYPLDDQLAIVTGLYAAGEGPRCDPIEFSVDCPEVEDFLTRIEANGGIEPSIEEQFIVCEFITGMKDAGLWDKMYAVHYFSNNGRETGLTWLKQGTFPTLLDNTWAKEFDAPPVDVSGQKFTAVGFDNDTCFYDTTVPANSLWTDSNVGFTSYASRIHWQDLIPMVIGTHFQAIPSGGGAAKVVGLAPWNAFSTDPVFGHTWGNCFDWFFGRLLVTEGTQLAAQNTNVGCGYYSMNRITSGEAKIYYAASNQAHTLLKSSTAADNNVGVPDGNIRLWSDKLQGNEYQGATSFLAFHVGLTEPESATMFGLVQTFRMALGGGYI